MLLLSANADLSFDMPGLIDPNASVESVKESSFTHLYTYIDHGTLGAMVCTENLVASRW